MTDLTIQRVLFRTVDPTVMLDGKPIPAMTTMLHRVCENDETKFDEALRLVELFIKEALKGESDPDLVRQHFKEQSDKAAEAAKRAGVTPHPRVAEIKQKQ